MFFLVHHQMTPQTFLATSWRGLTPPVGSCLSILEKQADIKGRETMGSNGKQEKEDINIILKEVEEEAQHVACTNYQRASLLFWRKGKEQSNKVEICEELHFTECYGPPAFYKGVL